MRRALFIWLAASALGAVLIALLPEDLFGPGQLFRLSSRHGPGLADGVGLAFIFGGWLFYLYALWSHRRALQPAWAVIALIACTLAASGACIAAIMADQDVWALAAGALAVAAQIGLGFTARRA